LRTGARWPWPLLASMGLLAVLVAWAAWRTADPLRVFAELSLEERIVMLREPIRAAADEAGIDAYLLAGLVATESSGRPRARSSVGALGLTQLRPDTAAEQARLMKLPAPSERELLENPALNLRLGAGYLARLIKRQGGSIPQALMAYNTGPTRFNRWLTEAGGYEAWLAKREQDAKPKPGTVLHYAQKVQDWARRLERRRRLEAPPPDPG
jgi:soluble lytic murein transglycosylase-like protein